MKTCLIIGGSIHALEEAREAQDSLLIEDVIAVKHAGAVWPQRLRAWVTLHPSDFPALWNERQMMGYPTVLDVWCHLPSEGMKWHPEKGGTSALLAVHIAREAYGFVRIVLAGVPLDESPYFHKPGRLGGLERYRSAWLRDYKALAPFVRSMSGWTKELFGAPPKEWHKDSAP